MIAFTVQKENSSSSPLSLSTPEEKPTISFSELLKGVSSKKDGKGIQNGALVLSLAADAKDIKMTAKTSTKEQSLLALLKNNKKEAAIEKEDAKELVELNPKLASALTPSEIKTLVSDAKEYLKAQILKSDDYKRSQIKNLPKTLKGLAEMAKKFGVDVSKITLEEVQPKKFDLKELKTEKKDTKEAKTETTNTKETKVKHSHTKEAKSEQKADTIVDVDALKQEKVAKSDASKEDMKSMTLFKAQSSSKEYTTEQLVQTKVNSTFKVEDKSPKSKADETLKLLLRGEKPSMENPRLTADFSVATAKVLAPEASTEMTKSLEKLLQGDKEESKSNAKVDGLTTHKADSFEVKLNEAKQMVKYLSSDVKTAIEEYKAPFTRVKVQLNPQRLGEVDLTIVQRGKNLHVSISSNNTAINTLAMNANELKTQLSNNGINNATLNFNNGSDNPGSNQQQGQRQNQKQAHEEYNYFENEENNEEILSSLEIVVPRYI